MANEVAKCLKTAQNNGKPIITQRGIGQKDNFVFNDEDQLSTFLSRSEMLKNENNDCYFPQSNELWLEVAFTWDLNVDFVGCYREDYQIIENMFDEEGDQTCLSNKYCTTILSPEISEHDKMYLFAQPIPDYVRWLKTGGELHYFLFEKITKIDTDVIDATPAAFLPSRILDIIFKLFRHDVDSTMPSIALFSWCPEDEVKNTFLISPKS